jgi:hypothetical protein
MLRNAASSAAGSTNAVAGPPHLFADEPEQRLHLFALLAQLLELALHPAFGEHAGSRADANAIGSPVHVADGHEGQRGAVFALDAERCAKGAATDVAVGLAKPALARFVPRRDA